MSAGVILAFMAVIAAVAVLIWWALRQVAAAPPLAEQDEEEHEARFLLGAGLPFTSTYVTRDDTPRERSRARGSATRRRRR